MQYSGVDAECIWGLKSWVAWWACMHGLGHFCVVKCVLDLE